MAKREREAGRERAEERDRARSDREQRRAEERERARRFRATVVHWTVTVVNVLAAVFAVVLALHIVFVIFTANPHNPLVTFVSHWADGLVVFFRDLFTPADKRVAVLVDYGLAAIFWLIVGRIVAGLVRRIS
ncbi:MAG: hypothetical protein J2P14_02310 [Acidothermales bacterium]|nr:hypothetical protein [Acidothermales bacterium]